MTQMRRTGGRAIGTAAALVLLLGAAGRVGAAEMKIGAVNVARVFDSYERTKQLDAVLGKKGKQKESELEGRMSELKRLREGLELLNAEARMAQERQIETKADELRRFRQNTAEDLRRERNQLAQDVLKEIQQAINAYAKANGFSLILDQRSIVFQQDVHDVTDEVLTQLNGRLARGER